MNDEWICNYNDTYLSNCCLAEGKKRNIWELYLHLDRDELKIIFDFANKYNMILNNLSFKIESKGDELPKNI